MTTKQLKSSATVKTARQEIGRALSQTNPEEQLRVLNLIRQWAFSNQRQLGLDLSINFCAPVSYFCTECKPCGNQQLGIRLPGKYVSLEAVEYNGQHVPTHSAWRLPYDGVSGWEGDSRLKLFDNGFRALETDFTDCQPTALRYVGKDCEKAKMVVVGTTLEDREEEFEYEISGEAQITNEVFKSISTIRFCEPLSATVVVSEPDGKQLARFPCGTTALQFREYRILSPDCNCKPKVLILTANCSFENVYDDCDIVEFGSPLVWQTLARYIQLLNKSDKDSNDRANQKDYLQTAVSLITEQAAVESGESTDWRFRRAPIKSKRLGSSYWGARRGR